MFLLEALEKDLRPGLPQVLEPPTFLGMGPPPSFIFKAHPSYLSLHSYISVTLTLLAPSNEDIVIILDLLTQIIQNHLPSSKALIISAKSFLHAR